MSKLTAKQERFCQEYLIDLNASQAYIRAGYQAKAAKECASRLLTNANVSARVIELKMERSKKTEINAASVLEDIRYLADMCLGRKPVSKNIIVDGKAINLEVQEVNAAGANKALELLGKHCDLFTDRLNVGVDTKTHEQMLALLK